MFTGIIRAKGQIQPLLQQKDLLVVASPLFDTLKPALGASIAIDGVCLTVSQIFRDNGAFVGFELGPETLSITLLGAKKSGDLVNIEPALCAGQPMDGHVVQGHVDGLGKIIEMKFHDKNIFMRIGFNAELRPLIVKKGSIAVNGVSLTINDITDQSFSVGLVPYTVEHTCFSHNQIGDRVHLETDILGRYLLSMVQTSSLPTTQKILKEQSL